MLFIYENNFKSIYLLSINLNKFFEDILDLRQRCILVGLFWMELALTFS